MSLLAFIAAGQALAGLICLFVPDRLAAAPEALPFVQLLGAALLGFAALNWLARAAPVGGIYGRPILMGNFFHFFMGSLLLLRAVIGGLGSPMLWAALALYAVGLAAVALRLFTGTAGTPPAG